MDTNRPSSSGTGTGAPGTDQQQQQQRTGGGLSFSPMLVVMPDTTYQMIFRYRLRRHSTHNPRGSISRISDLFTFPIHLSRRNHPTLDHVLNQLVRILTQVAMTAPYSDPRLWLFQVTAGIFNKMPMMRDAGYSEHWPFIPVTLNQGKFTVDVLSRCGPPPLDLMVQWMQRSMKIGRASQSFADYSILYDEEIRMDKTADRKYILTESEIAQVIAGGEAPPPGSSMDGNSLETMLGNVGSQQSKRPLSSDDATEGTGGDNDKKVKI